MVDAQAIAALNTRAWKQCFAGVLPAAFLDRYTDPGARRRLTSPLPGSVQHVHEHAGEVTGWLWTLPCPDPDLDSATAYEVKGCYVHPTGGAPASAVSLSTTRSNWQRLAVGAKARCGPPKEPRNRGGSTRPSASPPTAGRAAAST